MEKSEGKKTTTKFTIQFSQDNPLHIQAAEILNRQTQRSKAKYIAEAILHYERCDVVPNTKKLMVFDEGQIEAVVNRILRDQQRSIHHSALAVSSIAGSSVSQQSNEEIAYTNTLEALDEEGLGAIASALDMFRRK